MILGIDHSPKTKEKSVPTSLSTLRATLFGFAITMVATAASAEDRASEPVAAGGSD